MPILTQPAFGPKLSIAFITGGVLLDVWALVWRFTLAPAELPSTQRFWYLGLLLTGLTFFTIGAFLGSIGRAARKAEMPPAGEGTRAEASIQGQAAANPNPVVAANMAGPSVVPVAAPGTTTLVPG